MTVEQIANQPIVDTNEGVRPRFTLLPVSLLLVGVGMFISGYLSVIELTSVSAVCAAGSTFNCEIVLNSVYSEMFGVPISVWGFLMYTVVGGLLLLERFKVFEFMEDYGAALVFGVALFAWMYSMWLIYVQAFILGTFCPWCLSHEANMTILFGVSIFRLRNSMMLPAEA